MTAPQLRELMRTILVGQAMSGLILMPAERLRFVAKSGESTEDVISRLAVTFADNTLAAMERS